jgi:hypothetical protein
MAQVQPQSLAAVEAKPPAKTNWRPREKSRRGQSCKERKARRFQERKADRLQPLRKWLPALCCYNKAALPAESAHAGFTPVVYARHQFY